MKATLWADNPFMLELGILIYVFAESISLPMSEISHHAEVGKIMSTNKLQSSMRMYCLVLDQPMDRDTKIAQVLLIVLRNSVFCLALYQRDFGL